MKRFFEFDAYHIKSMIWREFNAEVLWTFVFGFSVCLILTFLLSKVYIKYGHSASNRRGFAANFMLIGMTTMFIITIVKSSLALSLGLVGALSIVRFRAAIKEPEELAYIFLTVAIGLGCGAGLGLTLLTIGAFIGFLFVIWFRKPAFQAAQNQTLVLTLSGEDLTFEELVNTMEQYVETLAFKRSHESGIRKEYVFTVNFDDFKTYTALTNVLKKRFPQMDISSLSANIDMDY